MLTSPFVGLDAEELAQIRLAYRICHFTSLCGCVGKKNGRNRSRREWRNRRKRKERKKKSDAEAENRSGEISEAVREKLAEFTRQVRYFRSILSYTPIHDLLAKILEETGYRTFIAAMPGGEQRIANVEMLMEKGVCI